MPQEGQSKPCPLRGPFDQSRDIGDNKGSALFSDNHPQIGNKGRKGIVCDFRVGQKRSWKGGLISLHWDNRGGPHRRGASTQGEASVPPRLPLFGTAGGPLCRCGKTCVSSAAPPSLCGDKLLAVEDEILYHLAGLIISKKGAHRNSNDEVFSVFSGLVFAFSVDPSSGTELLWIAEIEKGGKLSICLEDHIPALPAVTAVRTSLWNKTLSAETETPISAVARLHMDSCFIDKLHAL